MKDWRYLIFGIVILISICSCQKKQEPDRLLRADSLHVEIPEPDWSQTLTFEIMPSLQKPVLLSTFDSLFQDQFFQRLSVMPSFKVIPSTVPLEHQKEGYHATARLQSINEDSVEVSYQIKQAETGILVYEENQKISTQEIILNEWQPEEELGVVLGSTVRPQSIRQTPRPEAIDSYQKGLNAFQKQTPEGVDVAIHYYKEALKEDSTFIQPLLGLAEAYLFIQKKQWQPHIVWTQLAMTAAQRILYQDTNHQKGNLLYGQCLFLLGDMKQAEQYFNKVIQLNQNETGGWKGLADIYAYLGLYQSYLKVADIILSLNPTDTDICIQKGLIEMALGHYEQAVALLSRPRQSDITNTYLAMAAYYQNDYSEAHDYLDRIQQSNDFIPLSKAVLAMVSAKEGKLDDALGLIELDVKPNAYDNAALSLSVAAVYNLLGRKTLAIEWINRAADLGYHDYVWLKNDPNFSGLSEESDFQNALERVKRKWLETRTFYK